jgi:hypothetical protein
MVRGDEPGPEVADLRAFERMEVRVSDRAVAQLDWSRVAVPHSLVTVSVFDRLPSPEPPAMRPGDIWSAITQVFAKTTKRLCMVLSFLG